MSALCDALCTMPKLASVTIKADPQWAASQSVGNASRFVSPQNVQGLLQHVTHRLSLAGLFPETSDYTNVLRDALVQDAVSIHIYILFGAAKRPSPFCYFLRQVMELNQMGRQRQAWRVGRQASAALL